MLQAELLAQRAAMAADHGAGFRLLTGRVTSPTLARQVAALQRIYPAMRWHRWEPVSRDAVLAGAVLAYGRPVDLQPRLAAADVIVALDSDLLSSAPGHLRYARDFATRRNPTRTQAMSRLYAIEPTPSLTGLAADHRFIADPREMVRTVGMLADAVLRGAPPPADAPPWLAGMAADLRAAHGRALVHAGPDLPAEAHALVHAMNEALGGRGATYVLTEPVEADPVDHAASMRDLLADMRAGRVHTLVILDSNPVYAMPGFADALRRVPFSLTMAVGPSETAGATRWSVPQTPSVRGLGRRARVRRHRDHAAAAGAAAVSAASARTTLLSLLAGADAIDSRAAVRRAGRRNGATTRPRAGMMRWRRGWCADTAAPVADVALRDAAGRAALPTPADGADAAAPPRSACLGRALRQQRVAAGTAAPD